MHIRRLCLHALLITAVAACPGQTISPAQTGLAQQPDARPTALHLLVGEKASTLSLAELHAMPQHTVTVHNGHSDAEEIYTGVLLSDVLAEANGGAPLPMKETLHTYVRATGSDGYWVLYSGTELDPALHTGDILIALTLGGKPLEADGPMKLVASDDRKPARWVRNLLSLSVVKVSYGLR